MNQFLGLVLKGVAMGAANVIPGVSGGTVALITGIYERLINALKACDLTAIRLFFRALLQREFQPFWQHIDGSFLSAVLIGVLVSIVSLAKLFAYLLVHFETLTMAFFFGLILISVYFVGRTVKRWDTINLLGLLFGAAIAIGIALLVPASENASPWYMFLCGVVAICSMILPGLSGSFVLIIMGNYALVLAAISRFDILLLLPLLAGCIVGLIAFSHFIAWVYVRYRDLTIALMTGFIIGSLVIIWPWKKALTTEIIRAGKPPKEVITGYDWFWPSLISPDTFLAILLMILGGLALWLTEKFGSRPGM